jgi:hypothetical protein
MELFNSLVATTRLRQIDLRHCNVAEDSLRWLRTRCDVVL